MQRSPLLILCVFLALLAGLATWQWRATSSQLSDSLHALGAYSQKQKIAEFTSAVAPYFLGEQKTMDFEARLQLENQVRALADKDILDSWRGVVDSTGDAAKTKTRDFLLLLIGRLAAPAK